MPDTITNIGTQAFYNCKALTSIVLPDSITSIGSKAFYNCVALTNIVLPEEITTISDETFSYCSNLKSVKLPSGVVSIGDKAFYSNSLASIELPNGLETIGEEAFLGCEFTEVTLPDTVTSIGAEAFYNCSSMQGIILSENLITIGEKAFLGCESLLKITIPESVQTIGASAFSGCSVLRKITLPDSVTSLGEGAFSGCSKLGTVVLSKGLTRIEYGTFSGCLSLEEIIIPDSVKYVGYSVFYNCINLQNMEIPYGTELAKRQYSINNIFNEGSLVATDKIPKNCTVKVWPDSPASSYFIFTNDDYGFTLEYQAPRSSELTFAEDYVLDLENDIYETTVSTWKKPLVSMTIPATMTGYNVTAIKDFAFANNDTLKTVVVDAGVIGTSAFKSSSALKSITIGENVKEIKAEAFANIGTGIATGSAMEVATSSALNIHIKIDANDITIAEDAFANAYNNLVFYVTDSVKAVLQGMEASYKGAVEWIYKTVNDWGKTE